MRCARRRTDGGVLKDDQQAGVVFPFNLESTADAFPLGKGGLNVLCLEFPGEAGQG